MQTLKTIKDEDFVFMKKDGELVLREAVRAVVVNDKNEIAILYVRKNNFYKIPGGGVEQGENHEEALRREVLEEAGCQIEIIRALGEVVEYRTHFDQVQKSYNYLARVIGDIKEPSFTEDEKADGFERLWMNIDKALDLIRGLILSNKDQADNYMGHFVGERESTILLEAKKFI